mgnify:CR=1 FL=1
MPRSSKAQLERYRQKRDFEKTPEPSGDVSPPSEGEGLRFVIQKHAASHLHYDLRLEMEGVMRSWAVPKGPSLDPKVRRLAMEVEDHPISYNSFEGTIPAGEYGGGTVMLWDVGTYEEDERKPGEDNEMAVLRGYGKGKISITFHGERLKGSFALVRTDTVEGGVRSKWLFLKHRDGYADPSVDITEEILTSVVSGRTMEEIAGGVGGDRIWHSNRSGGDEEGKKTAPGSGKKAADATGERKLAKDAGGSLLPMLATSADDRPSRGDWTYEPKYDGIRVLAFGTPKAVSLVTRNGNDKARQFPEVAKEVARFVKAIGKPVVLDGEIVALSDGEIVRFENLQGRMHIADGRRAEKLSENTPSALIAFDVLLIGGDVLMSRPWTERREALEEVMSGHETEQLRLSQTSSDYDGLIKRAVQGGWEGLIAKRLDARYRPGQRSGDWLKLKLENTQEFVVGGWTEPRNSRTFIGALLLGYFEKGEFIYAGHTGTGFNRKSLEEMHRRLKKIEQKSSPFSTRVPTNQPAHWTSPTVVIQVRFTEWTRDGKLRHPVYLGVREDKNASEVVREPRAAGRATLRGRAAVKGGGKASVSEARSAASSATAEATAPPQAPKSSKAPSAPPETVTARKVVKVAQGGSAPTTESKRKGAGEPSAKDAKASATTRRRPAVVAEAPAGPGKGKEPSSPAAAPAKSARTQPGAKKATRASGPRSPKASSAAKGAAKPRASEGSASAGDTKGHSATKSSKKKPAAGKVRPASAYSGEDLDTPNAAAIRELRKAKREGALRLDTGESLGLSSFEKVFFPTTGHTKGDVLIYYARMGELIVPWMKDRPLVLKRFPNGVEGESFYQQAAPESVPKGVRVETLHIEDKDQRRLVGGNLATLLYTIQLGAISFDPWHSRIQALKSADYTILDLDPGPGVDFQGVVKVARWVKEEMDRLGLHGALKTSGSSGIHIYLPLPPRTPLEAATLVAQIVATRVAKNHPEFATVERMRTNRPHGTVYVDYLQNILGKTVAGVYAVRAKKAPTVSTPLAWEELTDELDLQAFTIDTVPARVREVGDLWSPAMATPNTLESLKRNG